MKNGQQVAQLATAWETDIRTTSTETDELLSPEQRLLLAEHTYGYTIVHEFEYAGQRFQIRKMVAHKDAQKEQVARLPTGGNTIRCHLPPRVSMMLFCFWDTKAYKRDGFVYFLMYVHG